MARSWRYRMAGVAVSVALASTVTSPSHLHLRAQEERPELRLRARPNLAFAPVEIIFTGLLRGGPDDNEEFYCVSAEWDWDDDTRSESVFDCDPYEPGTSEIRRRFSRRHSYDIGGRYEVRLTLKRGGDTVETARTAVTIQGGRLPE